MLITLSKEFIQQYLSSILTQLNQNDDVKTKLEILDLMCINFIDDNYNIDNKAYELGLSDENIKLLKKRIIDSHNIDTICDNYKIPPSEIFEMINNAIIEGCFGLVYEIESNEAETNDKFLSLTINSTTASADEIETILTGQVTSEELETYKNKIKKLCHVKIEKQPFTKTIKLYTTYKKLIQGGNMLNKDFIDEVLTCIKIDDKAISYDEFCALFQNGLLLIYDLIGIIIAFSYNPNSEKKNQFSKNTR